MTEVTVTGGSVRGTQENGIARYLGIPYAAPPFGEHRFGPPAPVVPWDGVRDASQYGATVPKGDYPPQYQPLLVEQNIAGDECLNLNVWTRADAVGAGPALPVLVWIHGGSFMNGSGSVLEYDGTGFARDGVVCVTINYRLGAEGFLFTDEDVDGTANRGLQDQVAALRWVQENIASFGGDPTRVTIAGESAGAMSITTLLAMPSAAGLFAQAITQSGAAAHTLTQETARTVGQTLAESLGVEPTREAIMQVPLDDLVSAASDLVTEVQTAPDPVKWGPLALSLLPFAPVVDGTVLKQDPLEAFASGASSDVRVLIGSNRQEARLFFVAPAVIDLIDDTALVAGAAAYGLPPESVEVYRANQPDGSPGDVLAQIVSDWFFAVPGLRHAEARESGGGTTWVYRFDHPSPQDNNGLGACHAVEIPFVFDTIHLEQSAGLIGDHPSRAVADQTHATWVNFISTGDPGWAPYSSTVRTTGILTDSVAAVEDPNGDERALWDAIR